MAGINKYTGVWNKETAKHLAKRTLFGATKADVDHFLAQGLDNSVATLLTASPAPGPPVNNYNSKFPDPKVAYGATWINELIFPAASTEIIFSRIFSLKSWWMGLMLNQDRSLTQKMTFFWHNHFAVQMTAVPAAEGNYKYLKLLMDNCFGNVKTLAKEITLDPAMLFYLNGNANSATAPDENYARELQELFTVGKGPNSKFTEGDVKAAAKVLTGYRINPTTVPVSYYFDPAQHDNTSKTFSSFYNNTVITAAGQNELDALLNMIFLNNEVAEYIVRKLYIFFVYYKIDATVETDVIAPLAAVLRNNNYNITPVLDTLFKSEHFYEVMSRSCVIKNPLEFMIGLCKELKVTFPNAPDHANQYGMWNYVRDQAGLNGLDLGDPPSVSGWIAYYQIPSFHELWINSDSYSRRNVFIDEILNGYTNNSVTIKADLLAFAASFSNTADPDVFVQENVDLLFGLPLTQTTRDFFKKILLSGQAQNHYWTDAWNDYVNTPSNDPMYAVKKSIVQNRLLTFYTDLLKQSEYQLI